MGWHIRHPGKNQVRHILVTKNDRIGDIILSSCAFRELKRAYPDAKLTLIASKENKPIIEKNPHIDSIHILDHSPRTYQDFKKYVKLARELRRTQYDLGVDLRGGFFNLLLLYLAGAKYRIGFYNQYGGKFLLHYGRTKKNYKNKKIHHSRMRIEVLNTALGINAENFWPHIATDEHDLHEMKALMKEHGLKRKKFICIVPDASMEKKALPLSKYDTLIKHLRQRYSSYKIVLLGTDSYKINWLAGRNKNSVVLIKKPLRAVHLLFGESALNIAHDGAALHLAWTTGAPTLGLIAAYLPIKYIEPLGKNGHYLYKNLGNLSVRTIENKIDKILTR